MFWDPEPSNNAAADQPVWCLGCKYTLNSQQLTTRREARDSLDKAEETQKQRNKETDARPANAPHTPPDSTTSSFSSVGYEETPQDGDWPSDFVGDFESKFWMTYRNAFTPIPRSSDPKATAALSLSMRIKYQLGDQNGFSSDTGWGCMIRSGQSLLANTLSILRLGRGKCLSSYMRCLGLQPTDWRRGHNIEEEKTLLSLFADDPRAPFSIHNFVNHGASACGKYPGEWFGPSATARCIQYGQDIPTRQW